VATGDRFLVTLTAGASSLGDIQNVFAYEQVAGTGNAHTLADAFLDDVVSALVAIISVQTLFTEIYVVNLDLDSDFWTKSISNSGVITGDALPPFVSATFEYVRTTRAVQNGRKAFGTIPESSQIGGVAVPDYVTACNTLGDILEDGIQDITTGSDWSPRIWRRPGTYASGVILAPGLFYPVADIVFRGISSQNTRKIGRGS